MVKKRLKIVHVMGTRPHIIKFTPITDDDIIIWTNQHTDPELYTDLWLEMNLPQVKYQLNWKGVNDTIPEAKRLLEMIAPDCVIVYGDTFSTSVGADSAVFAGVKLAHIESGIRSSYDRIEDEIRKHVDALSDFLFCHSDSAADELVMEGIRGKAFVVGDVHYDEFLKTRECENFTLATFHRQEHVDIKEKLQEIFDYLARKGEVVFPCHPRTQRRMKEFGIKAPRNISLIKPIPYKEIQKWIKRAKRVITDSGGLTKEAFFAGCPVEPYEIDEWPEVMAFGNGDAKGKIKRILLKELGGG
jgi:UDP-N-acetylglucosamine 2-epimerase